MDNARRWTDHLPADAAAHLENQPVERVDCVFPDFEGRFRGMSVSGNVFGQHATTRLPMSVFSESLARRHPERDETFELQPDLSTAVVLPWASRPTLEVVHDAICKDGQPLGVAPRNVLRRVLGYFSEQGWTPEVATELEVYLRPLDGKKETHVGRMPKDCNSSDRQTAFCPATHPSFAPAVDDIFAYARVQGLGLNSATSLPGLGQFSFALTASAPLVQADRAARLKSLVRQAAVRHGLDAVFAPPPEPNAPPSAMRIAVDLAQHGTGQSLFLRRGTAPAEGMMRFVGGLQVYLPIASPLLRTYAESSRRVSQNPSSGRMNWHHNTRDVAIGVMTNGGYRDTVEANVAGAQSNPYLSLAATLAAGYLGVIENRAPTPQSGDKSPGIVPQLPEGLAQALGPFRDAHKLRMILGEDFCRLFEAVKTAELQSEPLAP